MDSALLPEAQAWMEQLFISSDKEGRTPHFSELLERKKEGGERGKKLWRQSSQKNLFPTQIKHAGIV